MTRSAQPLSHDAARDLLAAYALGACSDDEAAALEATLAVWPEGREELRAQMETASLLWQATDVDAGAPIGLEGRVISQARRARTPFQTRQAERRRVRRISPWWRRALPQIAAAGFAALAVIFGVFAFALNDTPAATGRWVQLDEATNARVYVTTFQQQPIAVLFKDVPAPPAGQQYRLWQLVETDGARTPLRDQAFLPDATGQAALPVNASSEGVVVGFAIALEPLDGPADAPAPREDVQFTFPAY